MRTFYTDFPRFEAQSPDIVTIQLPARPTLAAAAKVLRAYAPRDFILLNGSLSWLYRFALLRVLGFSTPPIIVADLVLRPPTEGVKGRTVQSCKKRLFNQVDLFINYFKDVSGYEKHYEIGRDRCVYTPFKVNDLGPPAEGESNGKYALMAGSSMRDYRTFVEAARLIDVPTAVLNAEVLVEAGIPLDTLPESLAVVSDDGTRKGWLEALHQARIIVLSITADNICASGISTYIDGFAMGKPAILTEGPGCSDVLEDEAVFVPPEAPQLLAKKIEELWNDEHTQRLLSDRARRYAQSIGGESDLYARLERICLESFPSDQG